MIKFIIWIVLCVLMYFVPASIVAFINLDWSYLDFTNWTDIARTFYCVGAVVAAIVTALDRS